MSVFLRHGCGRVCVGWAVCYSCFYKFSLHVKILANKARCNIVIILYPSSTHCVLFLHSSIFWAEKAIRLLLSLMTLCYCCAPYCAVSLLCPLRVKSSYGVCVCLCVFFLVFLKVKSLFLKGLEVIESSVHAFFFPSLMHFKFRPRWVFPFLNRQTYQYDELGAHPADSTPH